MQYYISNEKDPMLIFHSDRWKPEDSGRNNKIKVFNNWLQCFACLATSEVKLKTNKEHVQ